MKLNKSILSFILGGIIFGCIGVFASYLYTASDISYTPVNKNSTATNVQEALDEIVNKPTST